MLSRRESIRLSARAVAVLMAFGRFLSPRTAAAASNPSASDTPPPTPAAMASTGPVSWDRFLTDLQTLTRTQHDADWDEAAYVEQVASLMGMLDITDRTLQATLDRYRNARRGFPEIHRTHDGGDYSVVVLQFEAGETIELHNHPRMTGVILCLTGAVQVEAFNLLEGTTPAGNLRLQQVDDVTLRPGDHATLTSDRGNIHALQATRWCELLDVMTPPYTEENREEYRRYGRSGTPIEGDDIYEAWEL